jgi:DNA-binding NtrC family response regulator
MKSELEMNHVDNRQPENLKSFIHMRKTDSDSEEAHAEMATTQFEDMRKFEPVIEHFCFKQHTPLKELVDSFERAILIKVLSRFNGNQRQSAKYLGMKSSTLNEKIKKHQIHFKKEAF